MRSKYPFVCLGALILAAAGARAQDPDAQKVGQTSRAVPVVSSSAAVRLVEAQRLNSSSRAAPVVTSVPPRFDVEAQRLNKSPRAAPVVTSAPPRFDVEAHRLTTSMRAAPVISHGMPSRDSDTLKLAASAASPSRALRTDLEVFKKGAPQPGSPFRTIPNTDLEALKRHGSGPVTASASRSFEEATQRVARAAIEAIPLQRAFDSSGSSIPPIRLTPAGRP